MTSPRGIDRKPGADQTFPAVDVDGEINPGKPGSFPVDPVSSQVSTSKELKEAAEVAKAEEMAEMAKKNDAGQKLKSALIFSGVAVAVIGVLFAVSRKLRET